VTEASISAATGISITGEKWFKAMALSSTYAKDLLKPEHQTSDFSKGVPRNQLIEQLDMILKIIQRYFTCEGRFNTLYQHPIRILLYFIGKVEMNIPYYLLRSICKMLDRIQSKSKCVHTSIFHSRLIRMLVSEELGKKEISWELFVVASHFKLNIASTPQSQNASPLSPTNVFKEGTSRKRKGRAPIQALEVIKQVTRTEEEVCLSPQRDFSPPPPPGLEEVPSSTKSTSKKGKKLHFPSSPPTANTKGRIPFTRSSIPREVVEEQSLPEIPVQKKKGKGIGKPVERKEETPVQKKKDKSKATKKPDEADKAIPMQVEEEIEKNHVIAKKKKSVVPNESPPSTRKSVRLSVRVMK
jgi:hypothetical protein